MFVAKQDSFENCAPATEAHAHQDQQVSVRSMPHSDGLTGLVAGTLVETDCGWQPVETLRLGDRVQTYDGGLQSITRLQRIAISAEAMARRGVLHVPGGALGNCDALFLLDNQQVMIEDPVVEKYFGGTSVLVPAQAMDGYCGIRRFFGGHRTCAVSLGFADEELIYANSGVLFHCAVKPDVNSDFFTQLGPKSAQTLLQRIMAERETMPGAFDWLKQQKIAA